MAKRHHKRKHYRGLMRASFGLLPSIPSSVNTKDAAIGVGIGLGAALLARYAWTNYAPATMTAQALAKNPDGSNANPAYAFVHDNLPLVGAIAGGAAAFFFGKKKNRSKAEAHAVGAILAGVAIAALPMAQAALGPSFQGFQVVRYGGRFHGILVPDGRRGMGGILAPASTSFVPGYNAAAGRSTSGAPMAPALRNTMGRRFAGAIVPLRRPV